MVQDFTVSALYKLKTIIGLQYTMPLVPDQVELNDVE